MSEIKKALTTTAVFLLIIICASEGIFQFFFQSENRLYQDFRERDSLAGSIDYVTIGSSIAEYGFVPEILDETLGTSSYNLGYSWMTMQGRLEMLKIELPRNPVKTVVVEISDDTLTKTPTSDIPEGDLYMIGRVHSFPRRICYFLRNISPKYYGWMYYQVLKRGIGCMRMVADGEYRLWNRTSERGYTPYPEGRGNLKPLSDQELAKKFASETHSEDIWSGNETALRQIIEYCRAQGVNVILVSLPLSRQKAAEVSNLQYFRDYLSQIADEYQVPCYDFTLLKTKDTLLPEETAYTDSIHLSNAGARAFSQYFAGLMQRAASGEDISGEFYENYDAMYAQESYMKYVTAG